MSDTARDRLKAALPHLSIAARMARLQEPDGIVGLAIIVKKPDGTGRMTASFECEGFIQDVLEVLGYKSVAELTTELGLTDEEAPE